MDPDGLAVRGGMNAEPINDKGYPGVFFSDPDGLKLEFVHFPWGYWRRAQTNGRDDRGRQPARAASPTRVIGAQTQ